MSEKVLLVDDDPNVLAGYRRHLRKDFDLEVAVSGPEGLELIQKEGPFAVIVSDMRMPGMDGVEFLSQAAFHAPATTRIMLTGNADLQTCIDAVNEGHLFRFLTKPCLPEDLAKALRAGIEQHRLVCAERELLQGTLTGCIRTLTDVLSLLSPVGFGRGSRIRRYVRHIAAQLNCRYFWEYEMAAALSHIGCIALPPEVLSRINSRRPLTTEQRSILMGYPSIGCQLLAEIPRLDMVARIVALQLNPPRKRMTLDDIATQDDAVDFGALILRVALDLDSQLTQGVSFLDALRSLHANYGPDHPIVESLMGFEKDQADRVLMDTTVEELSTGMVAVEDIVSTSGQILVSKGQKITEPIRLHLRSYAISHGVKEPISVEVLADDE